ncbi:hypothetical protein WSM22_28660 [Cytophagales bacterium WSM2-2]|nr:hypothetical protein WSM22_28660 [Cytophagales bacterium WSM2-2]
MKQLLVSFLFISVFAYGQEPKKIYKDTLGNVITEEVFKEKIKSGKYSSSYQTEGDNVTYFLNNRQKAEKEFAERMQKIRDKTLNKAFPDFKLKRPDGSEVSSASLKGKTIVVNFWFIGCKPCIAEMPLLNKVVERYKGKSDIVFLAPALDEQDKLVPFLQKNTFTYQVLCSSNELGKNVGVYAYPTHLVVDANGIIKELMVGGTESIDQALITAIDKIVAK